MERRMCFFHSDDPKRARLPKDNPIFCSRACLEREAVESVLQIHKWCVKHQKWETESDQHDDD